MCMPVIRNIMRSMWPVHRDQFQSGSRNVMSNLLIFLMKCLNASVPTCFAFHAAQQPQSSEVPSHVTWQPRYFGEWNSPCQNSSSVKCIWNTIMCLGVYIVIFEFCIGCVVPFWCFWSSFARVSISALFARCCLWISLWCFGKMPPCCFRGGFLLFFLFCARNAFWESKARRGCPPQQTTKGTSLPGLGGSPQIK